MPENYLEKVIKLALPFKPVGQPQLADWERLERTLNLVFPSDYKSLVSSLGTGDFGLGFVLKNPIASSLYARMSLDMLLQYRDTVSFLEERMGIVFYPKEMGLVLIGGIDRQHFFLKPEKQGEQLTHLFYLDHDIEEAREIPTCLTQFLYDLYVGNMSGGWAQELRNSIWMEGTIPFFQAKPM